uniref:Uncharacterized protein n=1 Tax=Tanacetum cinerariifolium TaxID=118510 RepID=A0A6L2K7X8_TANCI|nr:hypothetical protein [Tanacetum cinerariifolium]
MPSRAQILWGMFYKKNVNFVALLWEDFMFQADNREISFARKENMPYPRFTKVIISHLIYKDKTISIRNMINLHTIRDDSLLGTFKYVCKTEEYEKYGALIPEHMINQAIEDSKEYKIYLAYATGAATPKKAKKKRDTTIHQASGSSKGADSESEVPDEPKGKSIDTSKGTSLKPVVPNVSTTVSSESKNESWGDSGDENKQGDDEDVLKSDDDHEQADDVTEEEYERINEELYGDVNIRLTDAEPDDEDKGDKKMTNAKTKDAKHVNVNQEGAVVSMLDVNVQHEVPCTLPLLFIHVFVISEHNVINPPKTVIITLATTISSLMSSLFPHLQQLTPIPTPTTTEATTLTTTVPDSKTLSTFHQRITNLEKDNNPEGKEYSFDLSKPLPLIIEQGRQVVPVDYLINNDLEYLRRGSSSKKYTTSTTTKKAAKYDIPDIKDMGPSLWSPKKLNITKPETFRSEISNRTPYTAYNNPQGIIYKDKYKRNRLIHTDELYKYSDRTLTSVRSFLHDIASNLRMDYFLKRRWSSLDRKRSRIMIKAIDKLLLERRLMRILEKFIGGRDYGEDLKLLERII